MEKASKITRLDRILAALNKDKEVAYIDLEGLDKKIHVVKSIGWITIAKITGRVYATTSANLFLGRLPLFKDEKCFLELHPEELETVEWDQKK